MATLRCPTCGADVDPDSATCPACGAAVPTAADATAAFTPVVEREETKAPETLAPSAGPALVVKKGPDAGESFSLAGDVVTVGRDPGSDIFLNDITVSRRHARIERTQGGFTLTDVGSLNGTYVNAERIESHRLKAGDEIQVGKFRLLFTP